MHTYASVVRHFWTLEDTLVGYMFNDLVWCGQEDSGRSFLVGEKMSLIVLNSTTVILTSQKQYI